MAEQLDNNVVALMRAIRTQESGNKAVLPQEKGIGGASIYQYTTGTWKGVAQKYLGDANAPLNRANENKATYFRIKDWKDKGYKPAQIASMWNAGEGEPDAYTGTFKNGRPSIGTNSYGVKYNVPQHAKNVMANFQKEVAKFAPKQQEQPQIQEQPSFLQFAAKDILGGGAENTATGLKGMAQSVLQSTLGSKGAAGVGQQLAYSAADALTSGEAVNKPYTQLQESLGGLAEQTTNAIRTLPTITDPTRKAQMAEIIKSNLAQLKQGGMDVGTLEQQIAQPRKIAEAGINTALTALPGTGAGLSKLGVPGKLLPRVLENAGIGAGFTAASNIGEGRPVTEGLGTGALVGGAFPVAGAGLSKLGELAQPFGGKLGERVMNSLIKPLMKDLTYEKNPSRGLIKYVAPFKDFEEGIINTNVAIDELKTQAKQILSQPKYANKTVSVQTDIESIIKKAEEKAAKTNDTALLKRIGEVKKAVTENLSTGVDASGNTIVKTVGKKQLAYVPVQEAIENKTAIGKLRKWTGNASEDNEINKMIGQIYGVYKEKINTAVPELKSLNEGLSDLITASKLMEYRDKIQARQNLISFPLKLSAYGLGGLGIATLNPVAIGAAVANFGIDKLLSSPSFKTRLAKFLAGAGKVEKESLIREAPVFKELLDHIFGGKEKKLPVKVIEEKLDEIKLLPAPGQTTQDAIPLRGITEYEPQAKIVGEGIKNIKVPEQKLLNAPSENINYSNNGRPIITPPPTTYEKKANIIGEGYKINNNIAKKQALGSMKKIEPLIQEANKVNWRNSLENTSDVWRQSDILQAVANQSKSIEELNDVLKYTSEIENEIGSKATNIKYDVEQKLKSLKSKPIQESSLIVEAKKYKSAEEFVKGYRNTSEPNTLYHGTEGANAVKILEQGKIEARVPIENNGRPAQKEPSISLSDKKTSGVFLNEHRAVKFVLDKNKVGKTVNYDSGILGTPEFEQRLFNKNIGLDAIKRIEIGSYLEKADEVKLLKLAKENNIPVIDVRKDNLTKIFNESNKLYGKKNKTLGETNNKTGEANKKTTGGTEISSGQPSISSNKGLLTNSQLTDIWNKAHK